MMSNKNSARRDAMASTTTAIESLEGRTLFAAPPGPSFAAILSHVQGTAASNLRLAEHVATSSQSLADARQAAATVAANGKALLAADKAAIKSATDPAAIQAAKGKLASDKAQVKADLAAAKANLKTLQGQAKSTSASLKSALKEDKSALNAQLKGSDADARKAVSKLLSDWQSTQIGSEISPDDLQ